MTDTPTRETQLESALRHARFWLNTLCDACGVDPAETTVAIKVANRDSGEERVVTSLNLSDHLAEIDALIPPEADDAED